MIDENQKLTERLRLLKRSCKPKGKSPLTWSLHTKESENHADCGSVMIAGSVALHEGIGYHHPADVHGGTYIKQSTRKVRQHPAPNGEFSAALVSMIRWPT